jgi:1-deoxy-D-xylulose-5-phosphate reductoisomerase
MAKLISILGSTGSIGSTTFKILDKKKAFFKVNILSANKNFNLICKQIKKYNPQVFIINDLNTFLRVKKKFLKKKIKIINNIDDKFLFKKSDITICAIPGIEGLKPTIKAIKFSKKVLIANKESVICGWNFIKNAGSSYKTKIIPIDSEHFSLMKLLENHNLNEIKKIYITASGGPFLKLNPSKLKYVTPEKALNHPKWKMGKKISIDSSTLMNKILELIEAQKLFDLPLNKLDIIIHPESLVHAIIVLKNGLTKFIYHETSMLVPIANAIFESDLNISEFNYLRNYKNKESKIQNLTFKKVNSKIFPVIKLKNHINEYYSTPVIINAANETLVDQFLKKKIPFLGICKFILGILNDRNYKKFAVKRPKNINQILKISDWSKKTILDKIRNV